MDDNGALGSLMSGSGPTVFGLFDDYGTASECLAAVDKSGKARIYIWLRCVTEDWNDIRYAIS